MVENGSIMGTLVKEKLMGKARYSIKNKDSNSKDNGNNQNPISVH